MAKPDLGTKRVCPETGRKFYDLNKDPIVSPYTGKSYPLSFFEDDGADVVEAKPEKVKEDVSETTEEETETEGPEVLSLEDADEENAEEGDDNLPDLGDNTDDEVLDDDEEEDRIPRRHTVIGVVHAATSIRSISDVDGMPRCHDPSTRRL